MRISPKNAALTYGLLVLIWASTPLAIVWSVESMPAMWAMVFRFLIALPLMLALLVLFRTKLPLNQRAWLSYLAGSCSLVGSQSFTYLATAHLSSGIIALMFGLAPIIAGLIGVMWFSVRLTWIQWLGMLVALCGLMLICVMAQGAMHFSLIGIGLMLISVTVYCISIYWVKSIKADIPPLAQATGSVLCSTLICLAIIPFIWSTLPSILPSLKSIFALTYTAIMASVIAMLCYFKLVQNISATTLSLTTVLTPIIALMIGAVLNQEYLNFSTYIGILVIFSGLALYFYQDIQRISSNIRR